MRQNPHLASCPDFSNEDYDLLRQGVMALDHIDAVEELYSASRGKLHLVLPIHFDQFVDRVSENSFMATNSLQIPRGTSCVFFRVDRRISGSRDDLKDVPEKMCLSGCELSKSKF